MSQIDLKIFEIKEDNKFPTFIFARRLNRNFVKIVRSVFDCFPDVLKLVRDVVFLKHVDYSDVQVALGAVSVLCRNSALENHVYEVFPRHLPLQILVRRLKINKGGQLYLL